jgi:DNA-binding beta-propeller fold protein YncE
MKKIYLAFAAMSVAVTLNAQQHSLTKKWETDTVFKTPESVLYDAAGDVLYVANMNPDKPGQGSIGKLGLDGKPIAVEWVTGLTSPKGMGIFKNLLYVAELTDVAVIDIKKAAIIKRIPVEGASFLNDISVSKNGTVYVSDSRTFKIHMIEKGLVSTVLQNLQGPNGILVLEEGLMILDKGSLIELLPNNQTTSLAVGMDPSTDGIELVKPNEYIVSCWNGVIYYVSADGNRTTLLDTRAQKINSADIGYDVKKRIVYVPTFFKNGVVAYELK